LKSNLTKPELFSGDLKKRGLKVMESVGVEATKPARVEVAEATKRGVVRDASGGWDSKPFLNEQTPEEGSPPVLHEWCSVRVDAQEPRNLLAYLLNRGSSQE
jgi:hypothetical protein